MSLALYIKFRRRPFVGGDDRSTKQMRMSRNVNDLFFLAAPASFEINEEFIESFFYLNRNRFYQIICY